MTTRKGNLEIRNVNKEERKRVEEEVEGGQKRRGGKEGTNTAEFINSSSTNSRRFLNHQKALFD